MVKYFEYFQQVLLYIQKQEANWNGSKYALMIMIGSKLKKVSSSFNFLNLNMVNQALTEKEKNGVTTKWFFNLQIKCNT